MRRVDVGAARWLRAVKRICGDQDAEVKIGWEMLCGGMCWRLKSCCIGKEMESVYALDAGDGVECCT